MKVPLIFESAFRLNCLKVCHCHDEVVYKLLGQRLESSINISDPLLVDDEVLPRRLNVEPIENNLGKLQFGDSEPSEDSGFPLVVRSVEHYRSDMDLDGVDRDGAIVARDPETGHE